MTWKDRILDVFFADDEAAAEGYSEEEKAAAAAGGYALVKKNKKQVAAPAAAAAHTAGALKKCGRCAKKLSLAQQAITCACGLAFCDAHRPFTEHGCAFDYKVAGRRQLGAALHAAATTAAAATPERYLQMYDDDHSLAPGRRVLRAFHSAALLLCLFYWSAGWVHWLAFARHSFLAYLLRTAACSLALGVATARLGCAIDGYARTGDPLAPTRCRLCMWSPGALWSSPSLAFRCEVETLKENIAYVLRWVWFHLSMHPFSSRPAAQPPSRRRPAAGSWVQECGAASQRPPSPHTHQPPTPVPHTALSAECRLPATASATA